MHASFAFSQFQSKRFNESVIHESSSLGGWEQFVSCKSRTEMLVCCPHREGNKQRKDFVHPFLWIHSYLDDFIGGWGGLFWVSKIKPVQKGVISVQQSMGKCRSVLIVLLSSCAQSGMGINKNWVIPIPLLMSLINSMPYRFSLAPLSESPPPLSSISKYYISANWLHALWSKVCACWKYLPSSPWTVLGSFL